MTECCVSSSNFNSINEYNLKHKKILRSIVRPAMANLFDFLIRVTHGVTLLPCVHSTHRGIL